MANGVRTTNIENQVALSDELIVNRDGQTGVQTVDDFAVQMSQTDPLSKAVEMEKYTFRDFADMAAQLVGPVPDGTRVTAGAFLYDVDTTSPHITVNTVGLRIVPGATGSVSLAAWGIPFDGSAPHDAALADAMSIDGISCIYGPGMSPLNTIRLDQTATFYVHGPDWNFGQAWVDTSNNPGVALHITADGLQSSPYSFQSQMRGGVWSGPLYATGSVGVLIDGPDGSNAATGFKVYGATFRLYEYARKIGDNAYNFTFEQCRFTSNDWNFYFPSGLSNTGERISDINCSLSNPTYGHVWVDGVGNYHGTNNSYDYGGGQWLKLSGDGNILTTGCHFETDAEDLTGYPISNTSTGGQILIQGGRMIFRDYALWNPTFGSVVENDYDVTITGVRMLGAQAPDGFDTGSSPVVLRDNSYLAVSQVNFVRGMSELANGNFEDANLALDLLTVTEDVTSITDRLNSTNLALSQSALYANSGTNSLQVTKTFGASSLAKFGWLVPCEYRDLFGYQMSIVNPSEKAGNLSVQSTYVRVDGFDASGVPIIGRQDEIGNFVGLVTTASWQTFKPTTYINGAPSRRAPNWASHFLVQVTMSAWVGGGDSLYFDDVGIYRWQ